MNETRVEHKIDDEESLKIIHEMVDSYDPENETMVVVKVSGSLLESSTKVGSSINNEHLVGLLHVFNILEEQLLDGVAKTNPLKAALILSMLMKQKND